MRGPGEDWPRSQERQVSKEKAQKSGMMRLEKETVQATCQGQPWAGRGLAAGTPGTSRAEEPVAGARDG